MDVGVLVDVVDTQSCSSGGPQRGLTDSESPRESLERVELVRIDYT